MVGLLLSDILLRVFMILSDQTKTGKCYDSLSYTTWQQNISASSVMK